MKKIFVISLAIVTAILFVPFTTDAAQRSCPHCGGKGYHNKRIVIPKYSGIDSKTGGDVWVKEDCWRCHGTGKIDR